MEQCMESDQPGLNQVSHEAVSEGAQHTANEGLTLTVWYLHVGLCQFLTLRDPECWMKTT